MNFLLLKSSTGGLIALGAAGIGLTSANEMSKQTVGRHLKGRNRLVSKECDDEVWQKLRDIFNAFINTPKITGIYPKIFLDLRTKDKEEIEIQKVKDVCAQASSLNYSDLFSKDDTLSESISDLCSLKIGDVMDYQKKFYLKGDSKTEEQKNELDKRVRKIKEKNDFGVSYDFFKSPSLLKKDFSETGEDENWKKLLNWCVEAYSVNFFDKNDQLWKDVETYCKKDT